jgi:hypothetical protein
MIHRLFWVKRFNLSGAAVLILATQQAAACFAWSAD